MSFYKEQKKAFIELDNKIKNDCLNEKKKINITELMLDLTKKYELSEKNLLKRIEHYPKIFDQLKIIDNEIINLENVKIQKHNRIK